jgi:hypothetical protein
LPTPILHICSITRGFGEDSDGTKSVESESASEEESGNDKDSSTGAFVVDFGAPGHISNFSRQLQDITHHKIPTSTCVGSG